MASLENKYKHLIALLKKKERIAVAFSGGVDSTLLLHAAYSVLGIDNVIALYLLSNLNSESSVQNTRKVFLDNFPEDAKLQEVQLFPLEWKEFVVNSEERCYFCKKQMYLALQSSMTSKNCYVLADGTNIDDLKETRPGLRALRELNVITPLVDAGLNKSEIRMLSEKHSLTNHDLPSNSCLATRVEHGRIIEEDILITIDTAERFLHGLGFLGCRVRPKDHFTVIEVQNQHFGALMESDCRTKIQQFFQTLGLGHVVLSLKGR